jgi:hypothetical protein
MSNQDNKKPEKQTGPKKPSRGTRERNARQTGPGKTVPKASKSLNSNEAMPMLKFGPYNNFITFKERLRTTCMEKYGDLACLIDLEAY